MNIVCHVSLCDHSMKYMKYKIRVHHPFPCVSHILFTGLSFQWKVSAMSLFSAYEDYNLEQSASKMVLLVSIVNMSEIFQI